MKTTSKDTVICRDSKHKGHFTGGRGRPCPLEGCGGTLLGVRWDDGRLTYPCSEGLVWDEKVKAYRII